MNKNHSPLYIIVLAFMLLIASCDKPQSENKTSSSSSVDTENGGANPKPDGGGGEANPKPDGGGGGANPKPDGGGGEANPKPDGGGGGANPKPDGDDGGAKPEAKPEYSFSFLQASHRIARTATSYTKAVTEAHKPTDDTRKTAYSSSEDDIATVDNKGVVTFKTAGIVTIKAEKQKEGDHVLRSAQYTLYITIKPADTPALGTEIERATKAHGGTVDLNYIDTSLITDMNNMFKDDAAFNGDISKWDVSQVTTMNSMFKNAEAFNQDISGWDVSKVTNMGNMFEGATAFNQDISSWKVSQVTTMITMFADATVFNQDISSWNVSKVTDMNSMFSDATAFNQDISSWDVSQVTTMVYMFDKATAFNQNLESWGTKLHENIKAKNMRNATDMFKDSGVSPPPTWCKGDCQ